MRHVLVVLLLCGCGSSTPAQNDGSPSGGDLSMQQGGGDMAKSMSGDFAMSSGGDMAFVCGKPGMTGNEKGVGAYCTGGGGQCTMGTICPADFGIAETFCTLPCQGTMDTTTCGTNAQCQCQNNQCGCIPSCCLNASC